MLCLCSLSASILLTEPICCPPNLATTPEQAALILLNKISPSPHLDLALRVLSLHDQGRDIISHLPCAIGAPFISQASRPVPIDPSLLSDSQHSFGTLSEAMLVDEHAQEEDLEDLGGEDCFEAFEAPFREDDTAAPDDSSASSYEYPHSRAALVPLLSNGFKRSLRERKLPEDLFSGFEEFITETSHPDYKLPPRALFSPTQLKMARDLLYPKFASAGYPLPQVYVGLYTSIVLIKASL